MQGPYVLIFLNSGPSMQSKVSPGWLAACYRQMSYPFRKNVKFVILVRPSAGLRFMLAIMRPLVSPKAFKKVKKVGLSSFTGFRAAFRSPPRSNPLPSLHPPLCSANSVTTEVNMGRAG